VLDSLIVCVFAGRAITKEWVVKLINAATDFNWTEQDIDKFGARIYSLERLLAVREGIAGEDLNEGEMVMIDEAGMVRNAQELLTPFDPYHHYGSINVAGYGSTHFAASVAVGPGHFWNQLNRLWGNAPQAPRRNRAQFQYTSKFSKKVEEKALKLLAKYMSHKQYQAFRKGGTVELKNKIGDYRLLIDVKGDFTILQGAEGAGIIMTSGRCRSHKYPIGDEIAAFLDWFNHRTEELIDRWRCGTYDIKDGILGGGD